MPLIDAVDGGVTGIFGAPVCLRFLAAGRLAFGITAASLAVSYSRIRIEPPQADPAGPLPGWGHFPSSACLQNGQLLASIGGQLFVSAEADAMKTALRYFRDAAPHHTADEERGLFPALGIARTGGERIVSELERDHRRAEGLHLKVDRLGLLWITNGTLAEREVIQLQAALEELSALYREHIAVEEEQVFPTARTVLSREVLDEIGRGMAARRGVPYIPAIVTAIAKAPRALP